MRIEKHLEDIAPEEAFREAVQIGLAKVFNENAGKLVYKLPFLRLLKRNLTEISSLATLDQCAAATVEAAFWLRFNAKGKFESIVIINGKSGLHKPFKRRDWREHRFLLAHDKTGFWYAASPANLHMDGFPDLTIYKNKSLDEIVQAISDDEGGIWPSKEEIQFVSDKTKNENRTLDFVGFSNEDEVSISSSDGRM